jgi:hypothetical protein
MGILDMLHIKMHLLAHPQGGAQHDQPDKEKATHFLRPHVARNEVGVPGKNLQTHRHKQKQNREDQKKRQQRIDQEQQLFHEQLRRSTSRAAAYWPPPDHQITSMH